MNLINLYHKTRIIIFNPGTGWSKISDEGSNRRKAIINYLFPMALLIAVSSILGNLIFGDVEDSYSIAFIFLNSLISFLIIFLEVYLAGWLIFELAIALNSNSNSDQIFNLVIYSHAPLFICLAFIKIFPDLIFITIAGFYSFYLFWLGLEKLAGLKPERKIPFMLSSSLIMILSFTLLTFVFNSIYDVLIDQFINFGTP